MNRIRLSRRQMLAAPAAALALTSIPTSGSLLARQTPGASPVTSGPQMVVSATAVQFDEAFAIGVTGLEPDDEVTIRSSFLDLRGQTWTAEATYRASQQGVVDCSAQAPISGDFGEPDSMAFIWGATLGFPHWYYPTLFGPEPVSITATLGDSLIGSETVERTILPGPDVSEYIATPDLVAQYFPPVPDSPAPAPAIIVLGGSEGGISTQVTAALLASHGYAALAVGYFGVAGQLPPTLENIPLEYFGHAISWLQARPEIDASRLGVIGYSRGGELALLLGATYPEFTTVVSVNGSGYVIPGYNPAVVDPENLQPAWTLGGDPVSALPFGPNPTATQIAAAEIPVERINGPVLLIAGEGDQLWDSRVLGGAAWDRLQVNHHLWPDQFLTYPGAGHGILPPYKPTTFDRQVVPPDGFGGDPVHDQIASINSWRAILAIFAWGLNQDS